MTVIYFHEGTLQHRPGPFPDFAPRRLMAIKNELARKGYSFYEGSWVTVDERDLSRVHTTSYLKRLFRNIPAGEEELIGPDSLIMEGTRQALFASASLVLTALQDVHSGRALKTFSLTSPGGHHAEADGAFGFCFINHISLAARYALDVLKYQRCAILDCDAHHGNGTQSLFWNDPRCYYASLHDESEKTGFSEETGVSQNILNFGLKEGIRGEEYLTLLDQIIFPRLKAFSPEILFISAGFDTHREDPLSKSSLETEDFYKLGKKCSEFAELMCSEKLVAVMEGGYNLAFLPASVGAFVDGLSNK